MPIVTAAALFCLIVAVGDGDSLTARCNAQAPERVRIAAIDAPELRQAWGRRARQQLAALCLRQRAEIQPQGRDVYGRTPAQVRCRGRDVASEQVRAGLAWMHPSQVAGYPQLAATAEQARCNHTGLWSQQRPVAPWNYRRRHPLRYRNSARN